MSAAEVAGLTTLGFTDAAHTASNGVQYSVVDFANAAGYAAGESTRYAGTTHFGTTAWLSFRLTSARIGVF